MEPVVAKGPKLVGVDLDRNEVFQTIRFPSNVVFPTTYLNDLRFDLRKGTAGVAYITDSSDKGPNGIIVVDLAQGQRCVVARPHRDSRLSIARFTQTPCLSWLGGHPQAICRLELILEPLKNQDQKRE